MATTLVPRVAELARRLHGPPDGGRSSRAASEMLTRRRLEAAVRTHLHRHRPAVR